MKIASLESEGWRRMRLMTVSEAGHAAAGDSGSSWGHQPSPVLQPATTKTRGKRRTKNTKWKILLSLSPDEKCCPSVYRPATAAASAGRFKGKPYIYLHKWYKETTRRFYRIKCCGRIYLPASYSWFVSSSNNNHNVTMKLRVWEKGYIGRLVRHSATPPPLSSLR